MFIENAENKRLIELWLNEEKLKVIDKSLYRRYLKKIAVFSSREEVRSFFAKKEKEVGLEYALKLLSSRGYLKNQLKEKLKMRKINEEVINEIIVECEKKGFLDDQREIELFIKRSLRRRRGPLIIEAHLKWKARLSTEESHTFVKNMISEKAQIEQIHWWIEKKYHHLNIQDFQVKQKIYRFLRGKGFDEDIIRKILL